MHVFWLMMAVSVSSEMAPAADGDISSVGISGADSPAAVVVGVAQSVIEELWTMVGTLVVPSCLVVGALRRQLDQTTTTPPDSEASHPVIVCSTVVVTRDTMPSIVVVAVCKLVMVAVLSSWSVVVTPTVWRTSEYDVVRVVKVFVSPSSTVICVVSTSYAVAVYGAGSASGTHCGWLCHAQTPVSRQRALP